ncbi:MAG: iron ABC transporter permease [Lentisphaeria bacterium]
MPKTKTLLSGWLWPFLVLLSLLVLVLAPWVGPRLSLQEVWSRNTSGIGHTIFWEMRVPRVLLAYVAGASLSLCGMCFQGMFRNALATPYTLGVSSGASLGVAIHIYVGGMLTIPGFSGSSAAAFLGAVLTIILVYGLTGLRGNVTPSVLLLAGVAVSFFFSSLILFFQYLSDFTELQQLMRWLMGGLSTVGYTEVKQLFIFCAAGMLLILWQVDALNLLALGDEFATSRGVQVAKVRKLFFFSVSLMVGSVVAFCGPIGFVGMVCPHICRLMVGENHRRLAPASLLFGGAFLVICDTVARCLIAPAEIPTGIITALLGGPFFLWLLFSRRETI